VFYFALAEVVQMWSPTTVLFEVLSHSSGKKDVPGIATIHDALSDVDSAAGHIRSVVYVEDFVPGRYEFPSAERNLTSSPSLLS